MTQDQGENLASDPIFQHILSWKYAINQSCARWVYLEALFGRRVFEAIQIQPDPNSRFGWTAEFIKGGQVIQLADALPVATWSLYSKSLWWLWSQDEFAKEYREQSDFSRNAAFNTFGGFSRFGRDDVNSVFEAESPIEFDWSNEKDLRLYRDLICIIEDQLEADGRHWIANGPEGQLLFVFYFREQRMRTRLADYSDLTGHWTRQLFHHRLLSLESLLNTDAEEACKSVKGFWKHALTQGNSNNTSPEAEYRDLGALLSCVQSLKRHSLQREALQGHSLCEDEDPYMREFFRYLSMLATRLSNITGTRRPCNQDGAVFESVVAETMDRLGLHPSNGG